MPIKKKKKEFSVYIIINIFNNIGCSDENKLLKTQSPVFLGNSDCAILLMFFKGQILPLKKKS